ncbi:hypothetical protein ALNOE001_19370 [Candidatus Methanobinarius endosymbioticus]|uniref:Uncharacterized protein n=1 Tax=Candidatus Methanobinarius endosymbioticus TaxID=2006182 RepID=A0A366M8V6_9EURY|nr:hypothetical protein ALNOE001_19370 [Candidatus Methanobinarius endosymbioticus]
MGILNLTYLSNSTVYAYNNSNSLVNVYATLTDDMDNNITGQNISIYLMESL